MTPWGGCDEQSSLADRRPHDPPRSGGIAVLASCSAVSPPGSRRPRGGASGRRRFGRHRDRRLVSERRGAWLPQRVPGRASLHRSSRRSRPRSGRGSPISPARSPAIRLGTAVTCSPGTSRCCSAEQAATLDLVSSGRLDFGDRPRLSAERVRRLLHPDRGGRTERYAGAGSGVIRKASDRRRDASRVTASAGTSRRSCIEPSPVQKPHPPIWIGAGSRTASATAAEHGLQPAARSAARSTGPRHASTPFPDAVGRRLDQQVQPRPARRSRERFTLIDELLLANAAEAPAPARKLSCCRACSTYSRGRAAGRPRSSLHARFGQAAP